MDEVQEILNEKICPICHRSVNESDYLNHVFRDSPEVNYLAHMVTHYRHDHVRYWNNRWGNKFYYPMKGDYDKEKIIANERGKRQIIRKGYEILRMIGIKPEHFESLQNTDENTMKLANEILGK
jgi:hypothetical protein